MQNILNRPAVPSANYSSDGMTHSQKFWTAQDAIEKYAEIQTDSVKAIKSWIKENPSLPDYVSDEQIILFLHSCYNEIEDTKKCIEQYYKLRLKVPQFFENRDVLNDCLKTALRVLYYGIFPERTPEGYKIVFHMLNDLNPANYVFNDGFKLLTMMIDAVYAKEGPQNGLIILFDMKGVKLGHITKLPITSVKKSLEYLQDAIPVRLKSIHVLNVHSIIDKIMLLIKPFMRKKLHSLLHFHKDNDEVFKDIPRKCLPSDYGGELESVQYYHEKFVEEMESLRPIYVEEEELMFSKERKTKGAKSEYDIDIRKLNID